MKKPRYDWRKTVNKSAFTFVLVYAIFSAWLAITPEIPYTFLEMLFPSTIMGSVRAIIDYARHV